MKLLGWTPAYAGVTTTMILILLGGPKAHAHSGRQAATPDASIQHERNSNR
jgi:hypothetical protein